MLENLSVDYRADTRVYHQVPKKGAATVTVQVRDKRVDAVSLGGLQVLTLQKSRTRYKTFAGLGDFHSNMSRQQRAVANANRAHTVKVYDTATTFPLHMCPKLSYANARN